MFDISKNGCKLEKDDYVYIAMLHEFGHVHIIGNETVQVKTEKGNFLYLKGKSLVKAYKCS